jgi:acetyl esterase/lipase
MKLNIRPLHSPLKLLIRSLALGLALPFVAVAQTAPQVIHLWLNGAPGFESRKDLPEEAKDYWVRNINNPSVTVFPAPKDKANGCAVVVAPGGGFRELVFDAEGRDVANYLNAMGVTVFVLKYRLPGEDKSPYSIDSVRQDAYRAMRVVRSRAAEFSVDPNRIGMLGFSAGGALVLMVAFDKGNGDPAAADLIDRVNGRPNFLMMAYPGADELVPAVAPADTPPAFLICANDDEGECDKVTLSLLERFRDAKVSVEAHFVAKGHHGFNMGLRSPYIAIRHWPDRMADWLEDRGFLIAPAGN